MRIKVEKLNLVNILLFILVALPIYSDSPLSKYLGAAGYSLLPALSLALLFLYIVMHRKAPRNVYIQRLIKLGIWLFIISFLGILIWLIMGNSIIVVGEILPFKAIKVFLQYMAYPSYLYLILICLRHTKLSNVFKYSLYTLILLTVICIIELQQIPYAFQQLHYAGIFPYYRSRLLSLESSHTATQIYIYVGLSLFYALKYNTKKLIFIVCFCAAMLFASTSSKTLMLSIGITILVYVVIVINKLNRKRIFFLILMGIMAIVFAEIIWPILSQSFLIDIKKYSSVATRSYTLFIGVLIGIIFPLGVGGAAYLGVLQFFMLHFLPIFDKLPITLNTNEIYRYATAKTDVALTVKSGIMQFNLYWGIIGTIYLLLTFFRVGKKVNNIDILYGDLLLSMYGCNVVLLILSSNFTFEFWLLFAILLVIIEREENSIILKK